MFGPCNSSCPRCNCPRQQADPDIAGIGVIFSFLFSAALTLLAAIGYFLLQPRVKPRRLNPFDELFTRRFCIPFQRRFDNPAGLADCLFRVVLALSDQQLVTGIAILVAGFVMMARNTISVFHYTIILDLAWFSAGCHLIDILVIGQQLVSEAHRSKQITHKRHIRLPFIIAWRLAFIVPMGILLMVANWPSGYRDWYDTFPCSVKCVPWDTSSMGGDQATSLIITELWLFVAYTIGVCAMNGLGQTALTSLRNWTVEKDLAVRTRFRILPFTRLCYGSLRMFVTWFWYALSSEATMLIVMVIWFGVGCESVKSHRAIGQAIMSNEEKAKEAETGFGQLVPIFFLILPIIAFTDAYNDYRAQHSLDSDTTDSDIALSPVQRSPDQDTPENENSDAENGSDPGQMPQDSPHPRSTVLAQDDVTLLLRPGVAPSSRSEEEPDVSNPENLRFRRVKTFPQSH